MCNTPCCESCPNCRVEAASAPPISLEIGNQQGADAVLLKLEQHDEYARAAVQYLRDWLRDEPEPLLAMARGRHAEGHYRHGDSLMFEYDQPTLTAEAAQELADAICYLSLFLQREAPS